MTLDEILGFAKASAYAAFDMQDTYPSTDDAIASYRENIRDSLNEWGEAQHEEAAWIVFDATVAMLWRTNP